MAGPERRTWLRMAAVALLAVGLWWLEGWYTERATRAEVDRTLGALSAGCESAQQSTLAQLDQVRSALLASPGSSDPDSTAFALPELPAPVQTSLDDNSLLQLSAMMAGTREGVQAYAQSIALAKAAAQNANPDATAAYLEAAEAALADYADDLRRTCDAIEGEVILRSVGGDAS